MPSPLVFLVFVGAPHRRLFRGLGAAVAACAAVGCGATYAFVPTANATSSVYGHAAAEYAVPPQSPHGDMRVASYGIEPLASPDSPDQSLNALHIREFIDNSSDQPWTLDVREQGLDLQGHGSSPPAFATASPDATGSSPPVVTVAPHTTRLVDLFFPLPPDMQSADNIGSFAITSRLHTNEGLATESTPFARIETDASSPYAYDYSAPQNDYDPYAYGYDYWDSPFWYNSAYVGFYGGVVLPGLYRGHPVFARGRGWGHPGYYHGGAPQGGHGAFHGGGRGGGHR